MHRAAGADAAEQADVGVAVATVDLSIQPADGVVPAVKGAGVGVVVIAYGRPTVLRSAVEGAVYIQHILIDGDVLRQHGVGGAVLLYVIADNARIVVHQPGEPVEFRR